MSASNTTPDLWDDVSSGSSIPLSLPTQSPPITSNVSTSNVVERGRNECLESSYNAPSFENMLNNNQKHGQQSARMVRAKSINKANVELDKGGVKLPNSMCSERKLESDLQHEQQISTALRRSNQVLEMNVKLLNQELSTARQALEKASDESDSKLGMFKRKSVTLQSSIDALNEEVEALKNDLKESVTAKHLYTQTKPIMQHLLVMVKKHLKYLASRVPHNYRTWEAQQRDVQPVDILRVLDGTVLFAEIGRAIDTHKNERAASETTEEFQARLNHAQNQICSLKDRDRIRSEGIEQIRKDLERISFMDTSKPTLDVSAPLPSTLFVPSPQIMVKKSPSDLHLDGSDCDISSSLALSHIEDSTRSTTLKFKNEHPYSRLQNGSRLASMVRYEIDFSSIPEALNCLEFHGVKASDAECTIWTEPERIGSDLEDGKRTYRYDTPSGTRSRTLLDHQSPAFLGETLVGFSREEVLRHGPAWACLRNTHGDKGDMFMPWDRVTCRHCSKKRGISQGLTALQDFAILRYDNSNRDKFSCPAPYKSRVHKGKLNQGQDIDKKRRFCYSSLPQNT